MDDLTRGELLRLHRMLRDHQEEKMRDHIKWLVVSDFTMLVFLLFLLYGEVLRWMS